MRRPVVVTGTGTACGFGLGTDALWSALCEGRCAIGPIKAFDASGFRCTQAAEVPADFDIRQLVPKSYRKATKVMARDIEIAVAAADAAVRDAGLVTKGTAEGSSPTIDPSRFGCHIGAGLIACDVDELTAALVTSRTASGGFDINAWGSTGMTNLTPLWLLKYLPNMLACHVTIIHDCHGPSNTITCAEASGLLSMGESMRTVERGAADACLAGGAESKINPMGLIRQQFAGRLCALPTEGVASSAVKPYASDADGSVLGEGGGLIVLEAAETARARGATIRATVDGFAAAQCGCADTVGADLSGAADDVAAAMMSALRDATLEPEAIDAIIPMGTGIPSTDAAERTAFHSVFGPRAAEIPLVTIMPAVGNCGAGTGALQAAVAVRCLESQRLPARLGAGTTVGVLAHAAPSSAATLRHVMVVSAGLGGQVAVLILGRAA